MSTHEFKIGDRAMYKNHVAGYDIEVHVVKNVTDEHVITSRSSGGNKTFKFDKNGIATWSPNLSISLL